MATGRRPAAVGECAVTSTVLHVGAERAPFVMLPRWLLHHRDISDGAKVLYGMLHDLVAGREGPTRPVTRGQLADCCGVSVATIDRRLAELVDAGAVDKHAQFETHQGQLANVYWVRLSPRAADLQPPVDIDAEGGGKFEDPPGAGMQPGGPQRWGWGRRAGAAPKEEGNQEQENPPQPPRSAGGPIELSPVAGPRRRGTGSGLRAQGRNPRAEAELGEAARLEAAARARQLQLEQMTDSRRAADRVAQSEAERLEAEALALSGALHDATLADVVATVHAGMSGPLAASPLGVTRAVVTWCRCAVDHHGGALIDAVERALTAGLTVGEGSAPAPLDLPAPPAGTASLRTRVAALLRPMEPPGPCTTLK